jgi:hypothetical protein
MNGDAAAPVLRVMRVLALAGTIVTAALLAWSIAKDVPRSWSAMRSEHSRFAGYTRLQRDELFGSQLPLPMDIFDWYRLYLRPSDRYFIQVQNGGFGRFIDKQTAVRTVARLYLLPAIEATDLRHANVVLSFDSDPAQLHLHFSEQERLGQQLSFVSRIDRGA